MPATVRRLLRQPALHLSLLTTGRSLDEPIVWIHGSDLVDPTPFLSDGQMLLTTGTQLPPTAVRSDYDAYVIRLLTRGVVALGFGTEVVRSGTPQDLIAACEAQGLPLVEVPYLTPFIAIVRWAADVISREARAREDWSLAAQRAISLAALSQGGLAGVLATLAAQVSARVAVFDSTGEIDVLVSPSEFRPQESEAMAAEAKRLLAGGGRSASSIAVPGGRASLQTIGRRNELRGVLAIVGGMEFDRAAQAVITSAVALAEVALEQGTNRRGEIMPLHGQLFSLLRAGHTELVRQVLPELPTAPIIVALCRVRGAAEQVQDAVQRALPSIAERVFLAPLDGDIVIVVSEPDWPDLRDFLQTRVISAGASEPVDFDRLALGLAQARRALEIALRQAASVLEFGEVRSSDFLGILQRPELAEAAAARLSVLLESDGGRALLGYATVWLSHNGMWDPAARELGIHRHSLKARIDDVGLALDLSLDDFADRAQLWAMLAANEVHSTATMSLTRTRRTCGGSRPGRA
jgi:PucR family transcriptional regulator, purine catabolism regulatory protein